MSDLSKVRRMFVGVGWPWAKTPKQNEDGIISDGGLDWGGSPITERKGILVREWQKRWKIGFYSGD